MNRATQFLTALTSGDAKAADELMPLVYDELRRLAVSYLQRERPGHTLQPTALVNEAYLKLIDSNGVSATDRAHFFAIAARSMRQALIDHARHRDAEKRGGDWKRITLSSRHVFSHTVEIDLEAIHNAIEELKERSDRSAQVVELRFFGGLTNAETADLLDVSVGTVEGDWRHARAWLQNWMKAHDN